MTRCFCKYLESLLVGNSLECYLDYLDYPDYLDYSILDILGHGSKCLDVMGLDLLG